MQASLVPEHIYSIVFSVGSTYHHLQNHLGFLLSRLFFLDGQQVHENVLDIINHQGNANQKHNERSPHTCWDGDHQKTRDNKLWQECGEKGALVHCWW